MTSRAVVIAVCVDALRGQQVSTANLAELHCRRLPTPWIASYMEPAAIVAAHPAAATHSTRPALATATTAASTLPLPAAPAARPFAARPIAAAAAYFFLATPTVFPRRPVVLVC
jgi:hypothetical protein